MITRAVNTSLPPIDGTASDTQTTHIINRVTATDTMTNSRRGVHLKRAGGIGSNIGLSSAAASPIVLPAAEPVVVRHVFATMRHRLYVTLPKRD
jgi:hypothetical protein